MLLQAGMDAPLFELPDADMQTFSLAAQRGKKNIVLYFYPKDDTPGCTMEANEFTAREDDFARLDTLVVGVSRACRPWGKKQNNVFLAPLRGQTERLHVRIGQFKQRCVHTGLQ